MVRYRCWCYSIIAERFWVVSAHVRWFRGEFKKFDTVARALVSIVLTYVSDYPRVTYMEKTQIYLRKEELDALRDAAARSGRSVAEVVRDAIRKAVLKPRARGPVALWDGEPRHGSVDHDSVHDDP